MNIKSIHSLITICWISFFAIITISSSLTVKASPSLKEKLVTEKNIYLVRHAEKEKTDKRNPHLTATGKLRANNLAKMLKDQNIKIIYSTNYARTMETASPLAKMTGLTIKNYDPRNLQELAQSLKLTSENVLVVGHSNTTPNLVNLLGGSANENMDESEYDKIYQLSISYGKVKTQVLRSQPYQTK